MPAFLGAHVICRRTRPNGTTGVLSLWCTTDAEARATQAQCQADGVWDTVAVVMWKEGLRETQLTLFGGLDDPERYGRIGRRTPL